MIKQLLLIFILLIHPLKCNAININEYLNRSYIGISYEQGIKENLPLILVFANSKNVFSIVKMMPIGEMVYEDFKGKYNFCILNTKMKENKKLFDAFGIDETLPVLLVINTQNQTFYQINKKYYNKKDLNKILNKMYTEMNNKK